MTSLFKQGDRFAAWEQERIDRVFPPPGTWTAPETVRNYMGGIRQYAAQELEATRLQVGVTPGRFDELLTYGRDLAKLIADIDYFDTTTVQQIEQNSQGTTPEATQGTITATPDDISAMSASELGALEGRTLTPEQAQAADKRWHELND
jgi:hypothetical protein